MEIKEERRILADETILYGGMLLRYRLIDTEDAAGRFHLIAANGAECAKISVGDDICFAADCYRSVRDGRVTPCALEEVVADLRTVSVNFGKALYK